MEKFSQFIVDQRWLVAAVILIISAILGYQIQYLEINSNVIDSLPDDDPDAVLLKEVGDKFGGNRMGIIILETDNIYTEEVLGHIVQITDSLSEMISIQSVTSITNVIEIKGASME